MSKKLPNIDSDISSWYTEVVTKAGLADYGPVTVSYTHLTLPTKRIV